MSNVSYKAAIKDHSGNVIARFSGLGSKQQGGMSDFSYIKRLRIPGLIKLNIFGGDRRIPSFMLNPKPGDDGGVDYQIEIYRRDVVGGIVDFTRDMTGFLRADGAAQDDEGQLLYTASATGLNILHYTEEIAWPAGSAQAEKNGDVATVAYEFVDENIGPSAGLDPSGSSRVRPNLTVGFPALSPTIWSGARSYKLLSDVLQELASFGNAQYMIEDLSPEDASGTPSFRWRWANGIWGKDVRPGNPGGNRPVTFSALQGTASQSRVTLSRTGDLTTVYALGQGREDERIVEAYNDAAGLAASPWARRAVSRNWSSTYVSSALLDAGEAVVNSQKSLPDVRFNILQTRAVRYGREWDLGYVVRYVDYFGREFDVIITAVKVSLNRAGREDISVEGELYNG